MEEKLLKMFLIVLKTFILKPLPWKEHCKLIPDSYAFRESCLHSLIKHLKQDPVALHEYGSILKEQKSEGIIEEPPEKFKPSGTVHYLPHHLAITT